MANGLRRKGKDEVIGVKALLEDWRQAQEQFFIDEIVAARVYCVFG